MQPHKSHWKPELSLKLRCSPPWAVNNMPSSQRACSIKNNEGRKPLPEGDFPGRRAVWASSLHAVAVWACHVLTFPGCPHGRGRWRNSSCMRWQWKGRATGSPAQPPSCCKSGTRAPSPEGCTVEPSAGHAAVCWASLGRSLGAWPHAASWTPHGTKDKRRKHSLTYYSFCSFTHPTGIFTTCKLNS